MATTLVLVTVEEKEEKCIVEILRSSRHAAHARDKRVTYNIEAPLERDFVTLTGVGCLLSSDDDHRTVRVRPRHPFISLDVHYLKLYLLLEFSKRATSWCVDDPSRY